MMIAGLALALICSSPGPEPSAVSPEAEEPNPLEHALWMAAADGVWSIALTAAWGLNARSIESPQPDGLAALAAARVLYGTTWSWLVVSEIAMARWLAGPDFDGISHASIKTDWLVGYDSPAAQGSAFGLGGYSEIRARIAGGEPFALVWALSGGWLQGRIVDDAHRNVLESVWIQSPASVRSALHLSSGPFAMDLELGPSLLYGMHNAHLHPKDDSVDAPWHQIFPLEYGVGPGARAMAVLRYDDTFELAADADFGALLISGARDDFPDALRELRGLARPGTPTWRRLSLGLGYSPSWLDPVRIGVRWWLAELSRRPIERLGHRALMLRFEVPFVLEP